MIVDCHMHIWRYPDHFNRDIIRTFVPPRRKDAPDEWFKTAFDSPVEHYLELAEGIVDKAIVQGIQMSKSLGISVRNDYISEIVRQYPDKLAWCCAVNPVEEGAPEEVERCVKELGAIGVGELGPTYQWFYLNDKRCFPTYEKIQELGVPLVIHAGAATASKARAVFGNILLVDEVAFMFPKMKIVIAHLGFYQYQDAIYVIRKNPNVYGDISMISSMAGLDRTHIPRHLPEVLFPQYHWFYPLLYYFAQTFGARDKLIWGTDWSGANPRTQFELISNLSNELKKYNLPEIPEEALHNILHKNWQKVFEL